MSCARSASRRRADTSSRRNVSPRPTRIAWVSVHELATDAEALDAKVEALVASLLANGPAAVRACKRLVQDVAHAPISATLRDDTARRIANIRASDEGREGVQSFLSKGKPSWLA